MALYHFYKISRLCKIQMYSKKTVILNSRQKEIARWDSVLGAKGQLHGLFLNGWRSRQNSPTCPRVSGGAAAPACLQARRAGASAPGGRLLPAGGSSSRAQRLEALQASGSRAVSTGLAALRDVGSSWTMHLTHVSCIGRGILPLSH